MSLTHINNGDSGLDARNKINASFDVVDNLPLPSSAAVQTSNGATTSIATLSMGTYSTYSIEAMIAAYDSTNDLSYGSQLFAVFMKNSGDYISQVSTTDIYEKSAFSTATSHIVGSIGAGMGNEGAVEIAVFGEAGKTINWSVEYSVTKI
jgi:hypothetical protein